MAGSDSRQTEAPGIDAFLVSVELLVVTCGLFVLLQTLSLLRAASRLSVPFGRARAVEAPALDTLVVVACVLAIAALFDGHRVKVALAGAETGPHPVEIGTVFSDAFGTLLGAVPAVCLVAVGVRDAWQAGVTPRSGAVTMWLAMVPQYLLTALLVVGGFLLCFDFLVGSLGSVADPRLVVLDPGAALLAGVGYPLAFGGCGVFAGTLINTALVPVRTNDSTH